MVSARPSLAHHWKEEGIEIGMQQGIEIGMAKGKTEGREERDLEIAKLMLLKNKSVEEIVELTGLLESDIRSLKVK